jgi:predicted short-subunit dehydrogenase-like oxidoreductase (DUF2520 family)
VAAHAARLPALARSSAWRRADALFLAVPDDALGEVAEALSRIDERPRLTVHLSGARGLEALAPLSIRGCFHPLAALDGKSAIPTRTFVAVDGSDDRAVRSLHTLAKRMGLVPGHVGAEDRVRYHAGAVIAGNFATALLAHGVELLVRSGVDPQVARESLARLLLSTAENAVARPLPRAVTGPIARGDVATVARHLALLDREDPGLAALYRSLSGTLIDDVAQHPPALKAALRAALQGRSSKK